MGGSVNVTYETLFDLYRNELKDVIQPLPAQFHVDLISYLKEKTLLLEGKSDSALISDAEREKVAKQLQNIHKLVRDIYERRETKIIHLALISARGSEVDISALLPSELQLFGLLQTSLRETRRAVLARLMKGELPGELDHGAPQQRPQEALQSGGSETHAKHAVHLPQSQAHDVERTTKLIRFLSHVPKFVGTQLEIYGPFEPGDLANLPSAIADVLIAKQRAAAVSE